MRRTLIGLILSAALGSTLAVAQAPATSGPERGTLILVGGGDNRPSFIQRFVQLAGGSDARIVVIPTTLEDDRLTPEGLEQLHTSSQRILGIDGVTVMHTRDRKQADAVSFVEPLQHATGVWILGGNEDYLASAYVGTRTEREIKALLARGGVVGGTSAGAIIQGSVLIKGKVVPPADSSGAKTVRVESTSAGFGLLTNATVIPHWSARNLQELVAQALATQPGLLGIAVDEDTAAIIHGDRLEVVGDGHVGIYDGKSHDGKPYYLLAPGQTFDIHKRSPLQVT